MRNVMDLTSGVWGGTNGCSVRPPAAKHSHSVFASRNWVNESKSGHSRNNNVSLGWDGAGIGEQSLLAPHSLLCSPHPPIPGASLAFACCHRLLKPLSTFRPLLFQPSFATLFFF